MWLKPNRETRQHETLRKDWTVWASERVGSALLTAPFPTACTQPQLSATIWRHTTLSDVQVAQPARFAPWRTGRRQCFKYQLLHCQPVSFPHLELQRPSQSSSHQIAYTCSQQDPLIQFRTANMSDAAPALLVVLITILCKSS